MCQPLLVPCKVHKQHSSSSSQLLQLSTEQSDSPLSSRSRNSLDDQKSASQVSLFSERNARISPDSHLRFFGNSEEKSEIHEIEEADGANFQVDEGNGLTDHLVRNCENQYKDKFRGPKPFYLDEDMESDDAMSSDQNDEPSTIMQI